ncbi:MAG: ABC transporter ATP-binding protein [Candidatus Sumerlaeia bacterium]|nr:ABC transporter ATP-binding protein [Candidatus Sumerlaeia bacterium]
MSDRLHALRIERDRAEEAEALRHTGDWANLRRLAGYLAPMRRKVALAIAISIGTALLMLAPLAITQHAIDRHVLKGDFHGLLWMAALFLAVQALLLGLDAWNSYFINKIGNEAMLRLRMDVFEHLQRQPLSFFQRNPVGRLVTRLTGDVNTLFELFTQGLIGVFQQLFFLAALVALLFWTNWKLALWVLPLVPLVLLVSRWFGRLVRSTYRVIRVRLARLNSFLQENLTGMKTAQAFTRERTQYDRFVELDADYREANIQSVFAYAVFFPAIEFIAALGFAIVVFKSGLQHLESPRAAALVGVVSVGQLALFVQALERFFMPVRDLSEKYNLVLSATAAAERLFKLLDRTPEIEDPATPAIVGPMKRGVDFRDVWFAYQGENWVLRDVSLTIRRGQTVAVVGPTGSGKSTLMSLLCRFYDPQRGGVFIDGVDIRDMAQRDLRRRIAIVLQDVFLFHGTVAGNIRLGEEWITDERVREVAEAVHASEFIEKLPLGYANGVKERGATLSTGQKQLLSFARALAFDPEILILDEATANIDTETELLIQDALDRLLAGRTALVIAHRLSTIKRADQIVVLSHGHIAEQGTHEELLARGGLYRKLYELQFKEEAPVA